MVGSWYHIWKGLQLLQVWAITRSQTLVFCHVLWDTESQNSSGAMQLKIKAASSTLLWRTRACVCTHAGAHTHRSFYISAHGE